MSHLTEQSIKLVMTEQTLLSFIIKLTNAHTSCEFFIKK